jgi:ubiquinone/menaquinone biosynthesis C-methylase UbiE
MLRYYDERAPEYEEAYVLGTGTASIPDPQVFRAEIPRLASIVERFAHGRLIDLACGTGFWLAHYAGCCSSVTLFDQSERMLDECKRKIAALRMADRCSLIRGDFFDYEFGRGVYDCALVGFFLSHLTEAQEHILFDTLKGMLDSSGRFLILDSAWSSERARFNAKTERQKRQLNDGTRFEIYKRYCSQEDITAWARRYDLTIAVEHFGTAFCAVSGRFNHEMSASQA